MHPSRLVLDLNRLCRKPWRCDEDTDNNRLSYHHDLLIQGFRHKGLKRLFEKGETKGIQPDHIEKVENILAVLNRSSKPEDMNLAGFRLHRLKGFGAATVRANWRVIFRFEDGNDLDVDLADYR